MLRSHADRGATSARHRGTLARADSRDLVEEIYLDLADQVYRYLAARLSNSADAEDTTAQTFTAVLERMHEFRGDSSVRTWVFAIARRKAVDVLRSRRRAASPFDGGVATAATDVAGEALARVEVAEAIAALTRISADRAEAIRLRLFGGLSVSETASLLGKSEGAVKMLVHRGLVDLRALLGYAGADRE